MTLIGHFVRMDAIEPGAVGIATVGLKVGKRSGIAASVPLLAACRASLTPDADVEVNQEAQLFAGFFGQHRHCSSPSEAKLGVGACGSANRAHHNPSYEPQQIGAIECSRSDGAVKPVHRRMGPQCRVLACPAQIHSYVVAKLGVFGSIAGKSLPIRGFDARRNAVCSNISALNLAVYLVHARSILVDGVEKT